MIRTINHSETLKIIQDNNRLSLFTLDIASKLFGFLFITLMYTYMYICRYIYLFTVIVWAVYNEGF